MPRFAKRIRTHKIHPVHMALWLLGSICFQNLQYEHSLSIKKVGEVGGGGGNRGRERDRAMAKFFYTRTKPHSMTPGKGRSDLFVSHVEWERDLVIHQPQQISFVRHWEPKLTGWGDQSEEDQIAKAHQMCKSILQELYNSVACDICLKCIWKDMEPQQHHLIRRQGVV